MGACRHCGQPASDEFCCPGCAAVYNTLHDEGLDGFYGLRAQAGPPVAWDSSDAADWQAGAERFERSLGDGLVRTRFALEGLHCGACIWLIEKGLTAVEGVRSARVHLGDSWAQVDYLPVAVSLSELVARLARLGYRATPMAPSARADRRPDLELLLRMAVAGFGAGNIMMVAAALYLGQFQGIEATFQKFFHWICLLLATPVVIYSGSHFFEGARRALVGRALTMDVPISIGILVTYGYSLLSLPSGHVYFDSVTVFIFVLLIGRYLESASRRRLGSAAEHLLGLRPAWARLTDGSQVAADRLELGQELLIAAGETVPTDCRVSQGNASVDESMVTGESVPVWRTAGQPLMGGSKLVEGQVEARVEAIGEDTILARLVDLVEQAQASKSRTQTMLDRAAGYFVAVTLSLAAVTAVWWWPAGPERALMVAVSVLIITCPCALGLAAPMALWQSARVGLEAGVLFRDLEVIEDAARITDLVLDKTGTLTSGHFQVTAVEGWGMEQSQVLALAAAANRLSQHPLAVALLRAGAPQPEVEVVEQLPGRGMVARFAGQRLLVGSARLLEDFGLETPPRQGQTSHVWVALGQQLVGLVELEDSLRPEATEVVGSLAEYNLWLASGDRPEPVARAARRLALDHVLAEAGPEAKRQLVDRLQERGAQVAFLGDGVNDAPALAAARVGVAVAGSTSVATGTADVVLLRPGLEGLGSALKLARETRSRMVGNLTISALYNLLAIPAAMAGWVTPLGAAVAMPVASLLVVANSLRRYR